MTDVDWPETAAPGSVPADEIHEQRRRDLDEIKQIALNEAISEQTTRRRADRAAQRIVAAETAQKAATTEWPDPEPLGLNLTKRQPFPTAALPPAFRDMVRAVAGNKQVPEDHPALLGLAAAATLAAPRAQIQRQPGWTEPLTLYTTVGLGSANLKTPAQTDVVRALYRIEDEVQARWREDIESRIDELDVQRGEASLKGRAANAVEDQIAELRKARPPRVLFYPDTTVEALAEVMSTNGGCASIIDSEGEFFAALAGRYNGKVPNLGLALKAYDGDRYGVDRIGRYQEPMRRAVLALGLAVQPDVLEAAARDRTMRERGLLGRFLFALPESLLGWRDEDDATPYDRAAMDRWEQALRHVAALPVGDPNADEFPTLALSPEALDLHKQFRRDIEPTLRPDGELGDMPGWGGKHPGRVLRIAGLLHLLHGHGPAEEVTGKAMESAIRIGWWAIPHAVAVFGMDDNTPAGDDEKCLGLLRWARDKGERELTTRRVSRGHRVGWVKDGKVAAIEDVLERLADTGWLRPVEKVDGANRRSTAWLVWPGVFDGRAQL